MSLTRFLTDNSPLIRMRSSDSVLDAVNRMVDSNSDSVVIERSDGSVEGIFTENDLMVRVVKQRLDVARTTLADVMTKQVIALPRGATLDQAIPLMATHHIRHLLVSDDDGKIAGVISLRHLLHDKITQVVQELKLLEDFDDHVRGG